LNPVKLHIDYCSYEAAKYAVMHWHYSKAMPIGKLVKYGIWENDIFIGAVIFGMGASDSLGKKYNCTHFETCELVRIALKEHQTSVSKIVSICIRSLKKYCNGLKLIVSYADTMQNHNGSIYQAGNWIYDGATRPDKAYLFEGVQYHSRSISESGYKKMFDRVAKVPKPLECEIVQLKKKHKYLYPLTKEIRKQIEKLRKPYPKKLSGSSENSDTDTFQVSEGGAEPTEPLKVKELINET